MNKNTKQNKFLQKKNKKTLKTETKYEGVKDLKKNNELT